MKLRNKKTGEIKNVNHSKILIHFNDGETKCVKSLAELNDEWEDYEEPKEYWYIDTAMMEVTYNTLGAESDLEEFNKQIGNYFETKEEAEKAVEKLKAWKRLKDNGFNFNSWFYGLDGNRENGAIPIIIKAECNADKTSCNDLDLLLGGEE